ncbi:sensor domain-containing diguanylate cyclase [Neptunomonas marina]|uniref:Sensor domain-containing diguanylate cyclase n=1 Tax=Neptunomonas marina TaxID=1815562 RepID=A0A437Q6K0_9GAMM|nr:sensor domain-containing diguanylate cyclase [Neptunomonas marina]RVU30106.1 sensor domain-containing diguanylate cyclase [Neptunomonas marina]
MMIRLLLAVLVFWSSQAAIAAKNEPFFWEVFQQQSAVMMLIDPDSGRIINANSAAQRFYGYSLTEMLQMRIQDINALSSQQVTDEMNLAAQQNRDYFIFRHRTKENGIRTVEVNSSPYTFSDRTLLLSIVTDISVTRDMQDSLWHYQDRLEGVVDEQAGQIKSYSQQIVILLSIAVAMLMVAVAILSWSRATHKKNAQLLSNEQQRLAEIIQGTNVGTWQWDLMQDNLSCDQRWADICGLSREQCQHTTRSQWFELIHPDDASDVQRQLEAVLKKQKDYLVVEYRILRSDGSPSWVISRGKVVEWSDEDKPMRMAGHLEDINARKESERQMHHLAQFDILTDLPNRNLFLDRCKLALSFAKRKESTIAIVCIGLSNFRLVNDIYGHDAGDEILKDVAPRLTSCVRDVDTVARIGGDKFVLLLTGISQQEPLTRIIDDVRHRISKPYLLSTGQYASITCNIGIAQYPSDGSTPEALLSRSEEALLKAKQDPLGSAVFYACGLS